MGICGIPGPRNGTRGTQMDVLNEWADRTRSYLQHLHWNTENPVFFDKILTKIFGTSNERILKKLWPVVATINDLEPEVQQLSDEELRAKTVEFRVRIAAKLAGITDEDEVKAAEKAALDEILPEAFAVVREAGWRAV